VPELPEVETMVRGLRRIVGRTVARTRLSHDDILYRTTRRRLLAGLSGVTLTGVSRRAKHAVVSTSRGTWLVVQPGMTGSLYLRRGALTADDTRYGVLRCQLDDGRTLVYHDVRRIGSLRLLDQEAFVAWEAALGPEPLATDFTARDLAASVGRTRQAIKKALMDQRLLAGVGNIYANEALFVASIDPSKPANRIPDAAWLPLHRALRRILRTAIAAEGSTIRDYRTGDGRPGGFQKAFTVYGREGEPCIRCGTALTATHLIDARVTVFCHRCQR